MLCAIRDKESGEMQLVEMGPQIPGQTALDGGEQEEPKILRLIKQA